MKKTYYLIAVVILIAIAVLSLLNYTVLLVAYAKYFEPHNINIFFLNSQGKLLQNVSVTLFIFYPTSNGTAINQIYQGYNLRYLSIPISKLTKYAHYLTNVTLSLIGIASYYVVNQSNRTIIFYSQPFIVHVSSYNIAHGIGKTTFVEFVNPIREIMKSSLANSSNTTSLKPNSALAVEYKLDSYWVYPNSSSLAPIPLVIVYVEDHNEIGYSGLVLLTEGPTSAYGIIFSFGISLFYRALNFNIFGNSILLGYTNYANYTYASFGQGIPYSPPWSYPYFAEIYTLGQIVIANFTQNIYTLNDFSSASLINESEIIVLFITTLQTVKKNGVYGLELCNANEKVPQNILSYFTGKFAHIMTAYSYGPIAVKVLFNGQGITYIGYLDNATLDPIVQFSAVISDWLISSLSLFSLRITPFTINSINYNVQISIVSNSNNNYYVYYKEANITFNVEGSNYYVPIYYFYVNYTN